MIDFTKLIEMTGPEAWMSNVLSHRKKRRKGQPVVPYALMNSLFDLACRGDRQDFAAGAKLIFHSEMPVPERDDARRLSLRDPAGLPREHPLKIRSVRRSWATENLMTLGPQAPMQKR